MTWLAGWEHRKSCIIDPSSGTGTNYQIKVQVNYEVNSALFETLNKYASNPLSIPYRSADGVLHATALYFIDSMDEYKYWMVYTPYPPESKEEPTIVRSNDGINWVETGITNPVISKGVSTCIPDPNFLYIADYSKWFMCYVRQHAASNGPRTIYLATSTDGKTWAENCELINGSQVYEKDSVNNAFVTEPTMIYKDGWFYIWYCVANTTNNNLNNRRWLCLAKFQWNNITNEVINFARDAGNPIFYPSAVSIYAAGLGHISVCMYEGVYYLFGTRANVSSGNVPYDICLWSCTDKISWDTYDGMKIGHGGVGAWDEQYVYRAAATTNGEGTVVPGKVYFSGCPATVSAPDIGLAIDATEAEVLQIHCKTDFGDIRFTDSNGNLLDFWMESKADSSNAIFWVEVSDDLSTNPVTIYIYYGNSDATTTSNGENTFILFDDFLGTSLDGTKWNTDIHGSGSVSVADSACTLVVHPNVSSDSAGIRSIMTFTDSIAFVVKRRQASENRYYIGMTLASGTSINDAGGTTNWWQTSAKSGYWCRFYTSGADSSEIYENSGATPSIITNVTTTSNVAWTTCATYANWEMIYDQNGVLKWRINNILKATGSDTTFKTDNKTFLITQGSYSGGAYGANTLIDLVFIRKYVASEPTSSTFGDEETKTSMVTGKLFVIDKSNNLFRVDISGMTEEKALSIS